MSKYQTTIKLMQKNKDGKYKSVQFKSAEFLPGSVMEEATSLQTRLQEAIKTNDMEEIRPVMHECYAFIGNVIFEGQFTGEDYMNGMDAREVLKITGQLLNSVTAGYDDVYAEQKKK
jgi:hypothetical protein